MEYTLTMKYYSIGKVTKMLGKTVQTIRNRDKKGILKPSYKTQGRHRMYGEDKINYILQIKKPQNRINIGYARVSSKKQENNLKKQINILELYLAKQGKKFKIISDIGSGINYDKKG